jgi:hypothetical protein
MKLQKSQQGFTMLSLAFYLGLLAFVVFTTLKLFPVYMDAFTVESAVEGVTTDKNREYTSPMSVRTGILKRFEINNVRTLSHEDVVVTREDKMYIVDVDYEVRIPFIRNIDLVLSFENHAEVPAN